MKKVVSYRALYNPQSNSYQIDIELDDGTLKNVPLNDAQEFAAAIAVLRHNHVEYHEKTDPLPGTLETRG